MINRNYSRKTYLSAAVILVVLCFTLTGCHNTMADNTEKNEIVASTSSEESATAISFTGSSVNITYSGTTSDGVSTDGNYVLIRVPGNYMVSGFADNAQIMVDIDANTYPDSSFTLTLMGTTLTNDSDPVIFIRRAGECTLNVKMETQNILTCTANTDNTEDISAAVYADADLKIMGSGILEINCGGEYGILCKKNLNLWNGSITVVSDGVGIKGKTSVCIGDPDDDDYSSLIVNVTANGGDGIKATEKEKDNKGFVQINGGSITVKSHNDCIQASNTITLNGGNIDLYSYEGADYKGDTYGQSAHGRFNDGNANKIDESAKGLKSDGDITINDGVILADTTDDSIHSAGTLAVYGGNITASSADDGLHSDDYMIIDGGTITVAQSYEGLEAASVLINGGNIHVTANDDGINAAGKKTSLSSNEITINGGYTYVLAEGDGIDSNGTLTVNGGTLLVLGPTSGGNSPLDSDQGITITGGTVFAVGTSQGMWSEDIIGNVIGDCWINTSVGVADTLSVCSDDGAVLSCLNLPWNNVSVGMLYASADADSDKIHVYLGGTYSGTLNEDGYGDGGQLTGGTELSQAYSSVPGMGGFLGNMPDKPDGRKYQDP